MKHPNIVAISGALAVVAILALGASPALAANTISIDPGAYTGSYSGPGAPNVTGPQSVTLAEGTHTLTIAPSVSFQFHVDAAGTVSSLNAAAGSGSGSTLTFNTQTITVDPQAYAGTYAITNVDNSKAAGTRTFVVLPGISGYIFSIAPGNGFRFDVDTSGDVSSQVAAAAQGSGSTLESHSASVTIDAADYTGEFRVQARLNW